jgi:heme/copper-type cytochrome/quinol oxidase subunit 3
MTDEPAVNPFDNDDNPRQPSFRTPGTVGMMLFLAALSMLFGGSLFLYVYIRVYRSDTVHRGDIHLPGLLWLSTFLVIGVSVALTLATRQIRAGRHRAYRKSLTAALALAAGFLTVQTPAMAHLLAQHEQFRASNMHFYGLIFFLILLHALHVVGGMVSLVIVTARAHRGAYESPRTAGGHDPIHLTTLYWHFLDGVWLVMFGLLLATR